MPALLLGLPAALAGQADADMRSSRDTPFVLGMVVDRESRQPLEGVAVTLRFERYDTAAGPADPAAPPPRDPSTVLTDPRGRFAFVAEGLHDGVYSVVIARIGYQELSDSVLFDASLGMRIDVEMVPEALEMEPLLVVADALSRNLEGRGFYDRRRRGIGRFVSRDEIETKNALLVSDILRTMAGVRLSPQGRFRNQSVVLLRGGCVAEIYLDGVRTAPPFPVDAMLRPGDLDGVEVYHGAEMPPFLGTSSCGAVMLWTHIPNPGAPGRPFSWRRVLGALGFIAAAFLLTR